MGDDISVTVQVGAGLRELLHQLNRKVDILMTQQEKLDGLVAALQTHIDGIRQDIADLKAANPPVDFSGLEAKVNALAALDAENPPPAPAAPTS